jgi:hypothetical protein
MTLSDSGATDAPADDVRADIEAAFSSMAGDDTPSATNEPEERRDDAGRYAADEKPAEGQAPEAEGTKDEARQPEGDSSQAKVAPPEGWPSDANLAWDRLPKAAQDALRADLDAGRITVGKPAMGNTAPDPVREVVKAYETEISRRGMAPEQAVKVLFEAQRALDENPVEALRQLARSYGVDPANLAPANNAQALQHSADPVLGQLQQEVATLRGYLTQQQRIQHDATMAEQHRIISDFASTKAADGAAAYPHFEQVRVTMGNLLQAGEAKSLKDAYDMAVWARPDLRERILADQRKAEDAKRDAESRKAAEEAKKKAVSIKSNPSVNTNATTAGTVRDELVRAFSSASF